MEPILNKIGCGNLRFVFLKAPTPKGRLEQKKQTYWR